MIRRSLTITISTLAAAAALVVTSPGPAVAHSPGHQHGHGSPSVHLVSDDVVAPFQLTSSRGRLYVADGGTSLVSRVGRGGALTTVATGPQPGEVAGVAYDRSGKNLAYTATDYSTGSTTLTIVRKGRAPVVADLSGYEAKHNPDAGVTYGVDNPSQCVQDAFELLGGATSSGIVESHPYAVASLGHGSWVVADAAGNDLLRVDARGHVSTLAVLPRQPTTITADIAGGLGLPDCVVGVVYNFEPVPTDVEVGRDGRLYVSLLPGGPEDPSLGARGSVYTVSPWSGRSCQLATGFLGATNLALGKHGTVYVAELFAGRISTIRHGRPSPYVDLAGALSLTWSRGSLYAGTLAPMDEKGAPTGHGSIVRVRDRHSGGRW